MAEDKKKRSPRNGRKFALLHETGGPTPLTETNIKAARREGAALAVAAAKEGGADVAFDLVEYVGTVTATLPAPPDPVVAWE